jgi:hypothetical protein
MKHFLLIPAKASVVLLIVAACASCSKTGSLKVNVKNQSTGLAVQTTVIVQNTSDSTQFTGGDTPASGTVIFDKLKPATYKVSAQGPWTGSAYLYDDETVTIKKGHSEEVTLLLQ